jgi:DNA-binding NarL/FixJ family response regulator
MAGSGDKAGDAPAGKLRVAVVSEHTMARAGMVQALHAQPDMEVVGQFDSCRAMMAALMREPPDAVVLEMSAGSGDVLDALERCRAAAPQVAHVIVSHCKNPELAERAIRAGARGYLYHNAGPNSLSEAVRNAVAGELHICRCIASPLLQQAIYGKQGHKPKHPELAALSAREFQVFQLIGSGWDNPKIARELGISVKTLNAHKEHLKQKLVLDSGSALKDAAARWQSDSRVG